MSACTVLSVNLRPISRFASKIVFDAFVAAWFFAASPTSFASCVNETYDGVVRLP
jgi:hypothetical protein